LVAGILAGLSKGNATNVESATKTAGITGAASQQVLTALQDGHRSWWVAVLIGAGAFLWTTRTLMRNLTVVSAHAWQVPTPRPRQKDVLATTMVFAGGWLVMFAIAAAITRLDRLIPGGGVIIAVIVEGAALAAVWLVVSMRLPNKSDAWLDLVPGCLLLGFAIAVLHAVSRVYLPRKIQHSSSLYGSLGVAGTILFWLLIIGQIVVSAALVNSVWTEYRAQRAAAQTA
jgi:membrane protein